MFLRHFLYSCGTFYVPTALLCVLVALFVILRHFLCSCAIFVFLRHFLSSCDTFDMFLRHFIVFLWHICVPAGLFVFLWHLLCSYGTFCVPTTLFVFLRTFYVPTTLFCGSVALFMFLRYFFVFLPHFLCSYNTFLSFCGNFYVPWRKTNNFLDALNHRPFTRFPQPSTISHKALFSQTSVFVGNVIKALCKGLQ